MEKFRGVDYYAIESLLSEEERMIRDAVRDWVEAEFLPLITDHHRAGTFPVELISKLGELGVFGATLKGYGCAGLSNVAYGLIMQELERGAAVAFERGAEHAELAKLGNKLDGKRAGAVMVGDQRQELGLDPVADRVAHHTLVFGQEALDRIVVDAPKLLHPRISLSLCDAAPSGAPRARRPAPPSGPRRVRHGSARSSRRTGRPRPEKLGPRSRARRPRAPRSPTRSGSQSTRRRRRPPPAPPSGAGGPRATPAGTRWSRSPAAPRPHSTRRAPRGPPICETSDTPRSALARPRARASSGTGPG